MSDGPVEDIFGMTDVPDILPVVDLNSLPPEWRIKFVELINLAANAPPASNGIDPFRNYRSYRLGRNN